MVHTGYPFRLVLNPLSGSPKGLACFLFGASAVEADIVQRILIQAHQLAALTYPPSPLGQRMKSPLPKKGPGLIEARVSAEPIALDGAL